MSERDAFLKLLAENEDDTTARLVYADWLDEQGEHEEADRQRKWPAAKEWLVKFCQANNPPDDVKKLAKMACKANPDDCGMVESQYKDTVYQFVTPVEDEAKKRWKDTLARASQMGVTNDYVKKARENLSKYLPDEFPFIKDERIGLEYP